MDEKISLEEKLAMVSNPGKMVQQMQQGSGLESIEDLKQQIDSLKNDVNYYRKLNNNLIRICKERANSARNLKPKKQHTGYVVISSQEKEVYVYYKNNQNKVIVWETVLQSPYSIEFHASQARRQTKEELFRTEEHEGLLEKIGIKLAVFDGWDLDKIVAQEGIDVLKKHSFAFSFKVRANYRAGFWEAIILHSLPLKVVPQDMQPAKK